MGDNSSWRGPHHAKGARGVMLCIVAGVQDSINWSNYSVTRGAEQTVRRGLGNLEKRSCLRYDQSTLVQLFVIRIPQQEQLICLIFWKASFNCVRQNLSKV